MKRLVTYSSNTGNTKKLAEEIFRVVKEEGEWEILPIKDVENKEDYDVILLGGWCEGGSLNKEALKFYENLNKEYEKIGLFMTMGSRVETDHGNLCKENLGKLMELAPKSLGFQILQGYIARSLMDKLAKAPESVIPASVKIAMEDGVDSYKEPTRAEYNAIGNYFLDQLK